MTTYNRFLAQFTRNRPQYMQKWGNEYFQLPPGLEQACKREPEAAGIFLGEQKGKRFRPSIALLDWIAHHTNRTCTTNAKGAWLFLCKRDILEESIIHSQVRKGPVIVKNEQHEVLGLGELRQEKQKKMVKNILDRGDFLRREPRRQTKN